MVELYTPIGREPQKPDISGWLGRERVGGQRVSPPQNEAKVS
jgi:hypothetical protein